MTALAEPQAPRPTRVGLRRVRPAAILVAALAIAVGSYAGSTLLGRPASHPVTAVVPAVDPAPIEPADGPATATGTGTGTGAGLAVLDHDIGLWTANVAKNDRDFVSATTLGTLYDARGRLTGDVGDYLRAEDALDRSLAIAPAEMAARVLHARLRQTMHDFSAAMAESQAILKADPAQMQALATLGDAKLELGDISGAEAAFATLAARAPGPAVTARLSRVAFLRGDTAAAGTLAKRALDEATAAGQTGSGLGWYAYVAGTVAIATGTPADALAWFDEALVTWPDSYLALAGKARAQAGLGKTDAAIASYRQAVAVAPQPDSLTFLGDLYALAGNAKPAANQYATVEAIAHLAAINQQVYNRQIVLFSVNHDRDLVAALALATQELTVRKDVYGYDAYAWALLANGRAADAETAIQDALVLGTRDVALWYHAGAIAAAVGDTSRAKTFLEEAISLPGALDPLSASRATAALGGIR
jgi:tetratricopeptide (TPR) repeat protein